MNLVLIALACTIKKHCWNITRNNNNYQLMILCNSLNLLSLFGKEALNGVPNYTSEYSCIQLHMCFTLVTVINVLNHT